MSKLKGKVVVVTGASKGIGAGIAKTMAMEGANVVVNFATSKEGAEKVVHEITSNGGKAIAVKGDMSKTEDVQFLFEETKKSFGAVDVLVNNAGVYQFGPIEAITEAEFHRQFNVNVWGPIQAIQESLKYFSPDGGSVINISSIVSENPIQNSAIYSATKSALDAVTRVFSKELGPKKIRVNSILPGGVDTEGTRTGGLVGSDMEKYMVANTPLGRFGKPDDVAKVALFLASEDSFWVTGEKITVSGGYA